MFLLEEVTREREVWASCLGCCPRDPKSGGWMDGWSFFFLICDIQYDYLANAGCVFSNNADVKLILLLLLLLCSGLGIRGHLRLQIGGHLIW